MICVTRASVNCCALTSPPAPIVKMTKKNAAHLAHPDTANGNLILLKRWRIPKGPAPVSNLTTFIIEPVELLIQGDAFDFASGEGATVAETAG